MYKDDPRIWNAIMKLVAVEFQNLEKDGIELEGNGLVYPILMGTKGDWSYLAAWYFVIMLYIFSLVISLFINDGNAHGKQYSHQEFNPKFGGFTIHTG